MVKRLSAEVKLSARVKRTLEPPPSLKVPPRTDISALSRRFFRMMLTTPAIASEPYSEDCPPGRISMRSTRATGMPLMLLKVSEPLYSAG